MRDGDKDREQLQNELVELRKKIAEVKNVKISANTQDKKELLKSKEIYRLIVESTNDVITLHDFNLQATFRYVNPSIKDIGGYKPEELLGKSPFEFIHPDDKKKLLPVLKDYINAKIKKFLTGNELPTIKGIEFRFKDKEGNWRYIQSTGNIIGKQLLFITRDITDQKKIEEALRINQQKFASLFRSSPEALVYTDKRSTILDVNPRFTELFGYTLEEIKGRNIDDGMIHPSDKIEEGKKLSLKGLKGYLNHETIRKKKDGTLLPISISATPLLIDRQTKGVIVSYIDITERKQAEKALQESRNMFVGLFNSSPEAALYQDNVGTILDVNPRFTELFGYAPGEIKGRNIDEGMIYPPDKIEEGRRLTREILKKYSNYETLRKRKDDSLVPVSISISPVIVEGKHQGAIALYQDITERKQNEQLNKVLYNISQAANSPISLNQFYKTIHKELGTIIDTTNFYIALVDKKEDKVYFPYHQDEMDDNFPILNFSTSNTLTTYIIKTGKPLLNDNSQYEEMVNQEILSPEGSTSPQSVWLGVPLKIEDRVIGAMAVQSYTHRDLYTEKDINLLEFVSSQVATAIERKSSEEKIKHLSFHDSLTGLYNRAYFEEELERYNFPRYYPLNIVMLDVNGLKVINDTFGHSEGDRLLQHFSQLLTSVSRQGDILARIGGDEFVILLPSTTSKQAHEFCERIKKACQQDKIKPTYLRPNFSLGHTTQEGEHKDTNTLLKEADKKMYQDKLFNGKSREKHFLEAFRIILAERDPHTHLHAQRLQELALSLGRRVGLTEYQLGNLKLLALLHDIGKIGIPDSILFKTYILTPSEWKKMREHSRIGYRMAKNIPDFAPIAQEILYHHEQWDGNGYPDGLKGEKIPLLSRIISIIDAYDVMQSPRLYKGAISKTEAMKEIKRCAGIQFDPQLVEIFFKILKNRASRGRKEPDKERFSGAK